MSRIRLTAKKMLAVEMTKAALAQQLLYDGGGVMYKFDNHWSELDIKTGNDEMPYVVDLEFSIETTTGIRNLRAHCEVFQEFGHLITGRCTIQLVGSSSASSKWLMWCFECRTEKKRLITVPIY